MTDEIFCDKFKESKLYEHMVSIAIITTVLLLIIFIPYIIFYFFGSLALFGVLTLELAAFMGLFRYYMWT